MADKKKHHYIPACYLAGFTKEGKRTSTFLCARKDNTHQYGTNPNDSCAKSRYYKVDTLHADPLYIENWYAEKVEPMIGKTLEFISKNHILPTGDEMESLLLLVATLYLRTPNFRSSVFAPQKHIDKIIMSALANDSNLYDSIATRAHEKGDISSIPEHHKIRKFWADGEFSINANQDSLIQSEIDMILPMLDKLAYRFWQLHVIPDDSEDEFITSDQPFVLSSTDPKARGNIGILTSNTQITVPINKKTVLLGFLSEVKEESPVVDKSMIGTVNYNIVKNCRDVFYSSKETVLFSDGESKIWEFTFDKINSKNNHNINL
jgi:hypothetical protein